MPLQFKKAEKSQAKARIALSGPAGAGKTYTALKIATAMCKKVAVIDTEHGSASKYADEFDFDVLELQRFSPLDYVEAIKAAQAAGYDGLVIDSASHEWNGHGGCLELVELAAKKSKGNSYVAWRDVTPLHNQFIEALHDAKMHLVTTYRSKMDYLQTEDGSGKRTIQKVGMAPITREGAEYEHDIVGEMDLEHNMIVTKSRCRALADSVHRRPGDEFAKAVLAWLSDGSPAKTETAPEVPEAWRDKPKDTAPEMADKDDAKALTHAANDAGCDTAQLVAYLKEQFQVDRIGAMTKAQVHEAINTFIDIKIAREDAQAAPAQEASA